MYAANLRRYWKEHLIHVLVGAFAGWLLTRRQPAAGAVIMGTVCTKEWLTPVKRNNTPAIDLTYYIGGLLAGTVLGMRLRRTETAVSAKESDFEGKWSITSSNAAIHGKPKD